MPLTGEVLQQGVHVLQPEVQVHDLQQGHHQVQHPLIPIQTPIQHSLIPIPQQARPDYYTTSRGMREISKRLTGLMRHEDKFQNEMPFDHMYNYLYNRMHRDPPTRAHVQHMLSRYTQRYPRVVKDNGVIYYTMNSDRHAPHEDPPI